MVGWRENDESEKKQPYGFLQQYCNTETKKGYSKSGFHAKCAKL